jgi:hypothetical protein
LCAWSRKKLLGTWISGKFDRTRLTPEAVTHLSAYLEGIACYIPSDFQRKTRMLDEYPDMKATEHRLHLLYVFPVALRNVLSPYIFNH